MLGRALARRLHYFKKKKGLLTLDSIPVRAQLLFLLSISRRQNSSSFKCIHPRIPSVAINRRSTCDELTNDCARPLVRIALFSGNKIEFGCVALFIKVCFVTRPIGIRSGLLLLSGPLSRAAARREGKGEKGGKMPHAL